MTLKLNSFLLSNNFLLNILLFIEMSISKKLVFATLTSGWIVTTNARVYQICFTKIFVYKISTARRAV